MLCDLKQIGPKQAKQLLELNTGNFRILDKNRVTLYANAMSDGKWEQNGDTIKLGPGPEGNEILIDGQHRLQAVVASNTTQPFLVVRGVNSTGMSIDRGKGRTVNQYLSHLGCKNSAVLGTASKFCVAYNKGFWENRHIQAYSVPDYEVIAFATTNHDTLQDCIRSANKTKGIRVSASLLAAILFFGTRIVGTKHEICEWFVDGLATGKNLGDEDAVYHLRERLLNQRPGAPLTPTMLRALMTLAWNKTVNAEPCSKSGLRFRLVGPGAQKLPAKIAEIQPGD